MKTSALLPLALASLGFVIAAPAQQPTASDDPALRRMEEELGVDKLPAPTPPTRPQMTTRGLRTQGSLTATPAPPPAAPPPTESRQGFRVRGGGFSVRGGELAPESSPVVLSPSSAAKISAASPAPPPAVTISTDEAARLPVEAVALPAVKGSETQLDIQFELNSTAYLDPLEAAAQIARLAQIMGKRPDLRIMVEGHCCDLGDEHHNNVLSFYRAEALADHLSRYLMAQDTTGTLTFARARARFETIGFGENDPLRRVQPSDSAPLAESKRLTNRRARCRLAAALP